MSPGQIDWNLTNWERWVEGEVSWGPWVRRDVDVFAADATECGRAIELRFVDTETVHRHKVDLGRIGIAAACLSEVERAAVWTHACFGCWIGSIRNEYEWTTAGGCFYCIKIDGPFYEDEFDIDIGVCEGWRASR